MIGPRMGHENIELSDRIRLTDIAGRDFTNMKVPELLPPADMMYRALINRDASFEGIFFVGVRTTGIFCRPSCPSRPNPENVEFFGSIKECLFAGYRPCKRCHPMG